MSALLEVKNLSVDIPLAAGILHPVQDLTFSVDKGETLCIVGESGCGKSLTSLALMDLLPKKAIRTGTSILFVSQEHARDREAFAQLDGRLRRLEEGLAAEFDHLYGVLGTSAPAEAKRR